MKTTKLIQVLFTLIVAIGFTCCKEKKDEPKIPQTSTVISEVITGKWLLASSTSKEWAVYDFKKSQQMTAEWFENNILYTGSGMFFTNDEKSSLTATINAGNGKEVYLDWIAKKIQAFQIDLDLYGGKGGNELIGTNYIYKITGEQEIEYGTSLKIDYRKFTGSNDCSDFISLDESIVTVSTTGEIECKGAGSTYIIFNTPAGHAAIKVNALDKILSFSENLLGTWVTDVIGYVWERDIFGENGYFYAQWSREVIFPTTNESGQGTYTIDDATKTVKVSARTPYNMLINVEYRITSYDRYSFNTDVYSGGDKTGVFYYQRVLSSIKLTPKTTEQPNYYTLVGTSKISGYNTHNEKIATVDKTTGNITAVAKGITYIDVITNNGTAVVEVNVE